MKKILIIILSLLLFYFLYSIGANNIYTLSAIMVSHFNGIPPPTWIIMNTSYLYGPYITIPLMSFLWAINSCLYFFYWRWVLFYKKDKDISKEYIDYLKNKKIKRWYDKILLKGLITNVKWYYVTLIRLIPTPLSSSVVICSAFRNMSIKNFIIGNTIAVLITTTYFSFAIKLIKIMEVPQFIKFMLYMIHMF
jgi:hypothetical protein